MVESALINLPLSGTAIEQPEWAIDSLEVCRRVWFIMEYKPTNKMRMTESDDEFMRWINT